jgi:hypothetical protein
VRELFTNTDHPATLLSMSRRIRPADENNDGSAGQWSGGLPTSIPGVPPLTTIDYDPAAGDPAAGVPSEHTGGSYQSNVNPAPVPAAPAPTPFKLAK